MAKCIFYHGESIQVNLFKIAINLAENGQQTWFFSAKPFIQLPNGLGFPEKEILQQIAFFYCNSDELLKKTKNIFQLNNVPTLIIIYKFEDFLNGDLSSAAFFVASLKASLTYCSTKLKSEAYFIAGYEYSNNDALCETDVQTIIDFYFNEVIDSDNVIKLYSLINSFRI